MQLDIPDDDLRLFLSLLGLGLLHSIARGVLPADAGIWTLAIPRMWEPILEQGSVSGEIALVYRQLDELSAIQELLPERYSEKLDQLISRLEATAEYRGGWGVKWIRDDAVASVRKMDAG
ncbi:MAG: hypothetical protein HY690_14640 [Chloroflexi bacterium]|nr:hypothetical protein [Chloroflexota bacterium]